MSVDLDIAYARIFDMNQRVKTLETALRPFAALGSDRALAILSQGVDGWSSNPDSFLIEVIDPAADDELLAIVTVADLRRARAILPATSLEDDGR